MTFVIAAAGTGGHVFPGLSVGEALVDLGVQRGDVLYVGGDRLESTVYPEEGFPFLQVEIRGLQRSLDLKNLGLPRVVSRARRRIREEMLRRQARVLLGLGGYVTIPAALAARDAGSVFMHAEQNAEAGLANRLVARWAEASFGSFPETAGLTSAEWVGNPVRRPFWSYDRAALRSEAAARYGLDDHSPVLGVFGGSLGAGAINDAVSDMVTGWDGPPIQLVHLTGERNIEKLEAQPEPDGVYWHRVGFDSRMECFYAACDLVVARAGGAVAELTATGTPSILVPGQFGSAGHQVGNARYLTSAGAGITLPEHQLSSLSDTVKEVLFTTERLESMRSAAKRISRPAAARTIAEQMMGAVR